MFRSDLDFCCRTEASCEMYKKELDAKFIRVRK